MIGRLTGKLLECRPGRLLLDVRGVGYDVQIPLSTFYDLSRAAGEEATLHVHTHVREDAIQLYGFASVEERAAFEMLIGISGVGPRMALAILSGIGADGLREAVADQDRPRLQGIPGVGRKTAERVLLELRDRIGERVPAGAVADDSRRGSGRGGVDQARIRSDAESALVNLGYTRTTARNAVEGALERLGAGAELEPLLKAALTRLVRS